MKLTRDQEKAYDGIMRWMNGEGDWIRRLSGFAGTGKTTLLHRIINNMDEVPYCCAPTGKAASVLAKKLDSAIVTTVHQALYSPMASCTEKIEAMMIAYKDDLDNLDLKQQIEEEKKKLNKERISFASKVRPGGYAGLTFIVDEASMITNKMAYDFQQSGARVLFVGDAGQLPPVGDDGWFGKTKADNVLNEVTRQALDSPIIRLSMEIREKGSCRKSNYHSSDVVNIINKTDMNNEQWESSNQVLTGSNYLRRRINRFFRKRKGFEEFKLPKNGEKLICLKNDFESYGLINGVSAECIQDSFIDEDGEMRLSAIFEDEVKPEMATYTYPFEAHYKKNAQEEPWTLRRGLAEFDWAYAITVHKSQGSEWGNVILADDGFWRNRRERKQWLYTAITRAKEKFTWVMD